MQYKKLSELQLNESNPRGIKKEDFERLKTQIQKLGQYKPVLITKAGKVLGGNMRVRAYKDLGIEDIWVSIVDPKTKAEEAEYMLSDNDSAGYWEEQDLAELIQQLPELNLKDYKIDIGKFKSLEDLMNEYRPDEIIEDEVPELPKEAKSKLGEVYELGRHRLMCGDSTKIEDVEKLMNGNKADMVFTDPPYGMDLDTDYSKIMGRGNKYEKVIGDDEEWIFDKADHFDCAEQIWWGADWYRRTLPVGGSWFVWDKQISDHDGKSHTGSLFELAWSKTPHKREIIKVPYFRFYGMDTKKRLHPTQKPVELCGWFIEKFSDKDSIIIDLFGGSGSTLIACEQLDRTCYMMELDPKYCDVIRERYDNFKA